MKSLESIYVTPIENIRQYVEKLGILYDDDDVINKLNVTISLYNAGYLTLGEHKYVEDNRFKTLYRMVDRQLDSIISYLDKNYQSESHIAKLKYIIDNIHEDWKKAVIFHDGGSNGYDTWELLPGTVLFHGTKATFPDDTLPKPPAFYADIYAAFIYAFRQDSIRGELGKIISAMVTKPIRFIHINEKNLRKLQQIQNIPYKPFEIAFGDPENVERNSNRHYDPVVVGWLCNNGFSGFGYPKIKGFHNEIVLCSNEGLLRYDIEYRYVNGYQCVYRIQEGQITPMHMEMFGRVYYRSYDTYDVDVRETDKYIKQIKDNNGTICRPIVEYHEKREKELIIAIGSADYTKLDQLEKEGFDIAKFFHLAMESNNYGMIEYMLEKEANPRLIAIFLGQYIRDGKLARKIIDIGLKYGRPASEYIEYAVENSDIDLIKHLMTKGATKDDILAHTSEITNEFANQIANLL